MGNEQSMTKGQLPVQNFIHARSPKFVPTKRSIYSVSILANYAREQGISEDLLLTGSGIKARDLKDPGMFISSEQELKIYRRALLLMPDPQLGLKLGRYYNINANSVVAIPAMFCSTFLEALQFLYRYFELTLSYLQYDIKVKDDLVFGTVTELVDFGDLRVFICERELVSAYLMCSAFLGAPFELKELKLAYPRPKYAASYSDIFQCPVTFNADRHQSVFARKLLFKPLPNANALARETYEKECKRLHAHLKDQGTILERVRQELIFAEGGFPSFQQLSRRLNVSSRTLGRYLTAEGTSYTRLVAGIRKIKAIDMLNNTDLPIERIAVELGYNDVANFYHAFKSWTRTTPTSYRKIKP